MKHAVSRELYSYWDRLRKGRAAPERRDIDPAAIRGALSDTFIVAAEPDPGRPGFPVRLSGTRLNALFLSTLKERSLLSLWEPSDQDAMRRILQSVLDDAAPLVAGVRGAPANHRPVDLEMVLLPLRHHGRTHSRILGSIAPIEMPSWLGLIAVERLSLTSLRLIDPAEPDTPFGRLRRFAGQERSTDAEPPAQGLPRRYGRFTVHEGAGESSRRVTGK